MAPVFTGYKGAEECMGNIRGLSSHLVCWLQPHPRTSGGLEASSVVPSLVFRDRYGVKDHFATLLLVSTTWNVSYKWTLNVKHLLNGQGGIKSKVLSPTIAPRNFMPSRMRWSSTLELMEGDLEDLWGKRWPLVLLVRASARNRRIVSRMVRNAIIAVARSWGY
jgi:hypothetical protein